MLNYKDDAGADIAIPPHVNADRDEVIFKLHANIKNCYQVLVTKCEKHPVSALLKTIVIGDSRAVWKAITGHFVRTTAAGRAFATDKFYTSTMANTDTSLLDWIKTVNDLADSLETATRVTVPAGAKKHLLLSGLLPEFKLKKQMIQSQDKGDTLTLSECVDDLIDYAKEENLMDIKKGTSQRRNQTYYGQHDDEKSNGLSRNVKSKNVPPHKRKVFGKIWLLSSANIGLLEPVSTEPIAIANTRGLGDAPLMPPPRRPRNQLPCQLHLLHPSIVTSAPLLDMR